MKEIRNRTQGFTLLELLVVVLIIGILATIALPQYQMAVTKAKVASILPLMRRWYDALAEYKLQQGSYCKKGVDAACEELPDGFDLGVNWPSDWKNGNNACGDNRACGNDYWTECHANEEGTGYVYCRHTEDHNNEFIIYKIQPDDYDIYPDYIGMTICMFRGKGEKVCKALGGNKIDGDVYQL